VDAAEAAKRAEGARVLAAEERVKAAAGPDALRALRLLEGQGLPLLHFTAQRKHSST
jgi:hypothetical protein